MRSEEQRDEMRGVRLGVRELINIYGHFRNKPSAQR